MKGKNILFVSLMAVSAAALACSALSLGGDSSLFKDDFSKSDSGWSTFSSANSSVDYVNGEYVMQVFKDQWFVWGNPGESSLSNVHVEVTVKNVGGTADTSFGILCDYTDDTHYYYLAVDMQGLYAIAMTNGNDERFLTNNDQWAQTDQIAPNAASYRVGADCANGNLALYVDGKQIASVTDSTYTSGDVGLFAWTDQQTNAEIHFDDLVVTSLKK